MRRLAVLLLFWVVAVATPLGIEAVTETGGDGLERTWYRINTENGPLFDRPIERPEVPALRSDTGVLWVDRNHRYGIAQSVAISNDGYHILANWYLNAQRASYYRTLGTASPVWESPGDFTWGWAGNQIGVSRDGGTMTLSSLTAAYKWSSQSRFPQWLYQYPTSATGYSKTSRNGNRVVACQNGILTAIRAQDGRVLWSVPVPEPTRLQGIDLSDNGRIVAVTVYDSCIVFEDSLRRGAIPIGTSNTGTQYAAAISGDGSILVTGDYYGMLKLYRWDGSTYNLRWSAQVGTPWVAGVAVSRDGSRVACGTGYANGKLCVFDSSSAIPVMTYQNYGSTGAYVACVALSADGNRVAAASWGDIAPSGDFRVFTVHNVGDTAPLVAITRNDEPGSLFSCDISDDGQFACASGKAVHAGQMGNGGQVYAVLIGASDSVNAGTRAITAPGRYLQTGVPVTPSAEVQNYGDNTVSIPVGITIRNSADSVVYRDSAVAPDVAPGAAATVSFRQWTPDGWSLYNCRVFTRLPGDGYAGDDTLAMASRCFHDGRPVLLSPPYTEMSVNRSFTPRAVVTNSGSYTDAIRCRLTITDSIGAVVYRDSTRSGNLAPDDSTAVEFTAWSPGAVGPYSAILTAGTDDDFLPGNDSLRRSFTVTYELIYDDGSAEAYYWVGRRDNDKFYLRCSPTLNPPFAVNGGRIFVNLANTPFEYVALCPDRAGMPDTANLLDIAYNVTAPVAPGWAEFAFDVTRTTAEDFWLIARWPDNSPGMGIGADGTPPVEMRSYFSSNQDPFRQWTTHDWMMRVMQSPTVGTAEPVTAVRRLAFERITPNPVRGQCRFTISVPGPGRYELLVYDNSGRLVARPLDANRDTGVHQVAWSPVDDEGRTLPPGVYFARLVDHGRSAAVGRKFVVTY